MRAYRLLQAQAQPNSRRCGSRTRYPLGSAKQAYDDFERGRLVGLGVLIPATLR